MLIDTTISSTSSNSSLIIADKPYQAKKI